MNVKETKEFFKDHNVVALKADKGNKDRVDEMLEFMKQLGNPEGAIPFYAVFGPGLDKPITADALIWTGRLLPPTFLSAADSTKKARRASGNTRRATRGTG